MSETCAWPEGHWFDPRTGRINLDRESERSVLVSASLPQLPMAPLELLSSQHVRLWLPSSLFPWPHIISKTYYSIRLHAVQPKNKTISSDSLNTDFMEMPGFHVTAFGSLSDAVTRSGSWKHWLLRWKLQLNGKVAICLYKQQCVFCVSDCSALRARLPREPACLSLPSH